MVFFSRVKILWIWNFLHLSNISIRQNRFFSVHWLYVYIASQAGKFVKIRNLQKHKHFHVAKITTYSVDILQSWNTISHMLQCIMHFLFVFMSNITHWFRLAFLTSTLRHFRLYLAITVTNNDIRDCLQKKGGENMRVCSMYVERS